MVLRSLLFGQFNGIGPQISDFFIHLSGNLGETRSFTRGKVVHLCPLSADADGIENALGLFHPFTGSEVAAVIMTISFHTSHGIYAVRALFKGMENMKDIHLSGAWNENDFYVRRVLQSHGPCQVRSRITSVAAAECNDDRLEILVHNASFESIIRVGRFQFGCPQPLQDVLEEGVDFAHNLNVFIPTQFDGLGRAFRRTDTASVT